MIKEFKDKLKEIGISGREFAYEIEIKYESYRVLTMSTVKIVPKWVKAFMLGYKLGKKSKNE